MRLTLVTVGDPDRRTGGYRYHARLLPRLAARGVRVRQVVAGPADSAGQAAAVSRLSDRDAADDAEDRGADPADASADLARGADPADAISDQADVVVVDALARIAGRPWLTRRRDGRAVVALVHELPSCAEPGTADPADEEPLLGCDLLIAVSPSVHDSLTARGVPADRVRVVTPGYDRHCLDPAPAREQTDVRVLCVAQWIPRKGIVELLRAWAARDRTGARLVLVGETDADPAYAAEVGALLADDVVLASVDVLGSVDDGTLAAQYRSADMFALPSVAEGYGIVYAEALACGLPVLACTTGPVPDLVGDGGILVPPGDHPALVTALDTLLADAPLRAHLARRARHRARSLPTWDDCADSFLTALEEVHR